MNKNNIQDKLFDLMLENEQIKKELDIKKITLEEALNSKYPVYTRAKDVPEIYKKGVKHVSQIEIDGNGKLFLFHPSLKIIKPIYIYNVLQDYIVFLPKNSIYSF